MDPVVYVVAAAVIAVLLLAIGFFKKSQTDGKMNPLMFITVYFEAIALSLNCVLLSLYER